MTFAVGATCGRARLGTLTTLHGAIDTPAFMPVGTRGSVRTQTRGQLEELGAQIILANTYHLLVRPGREVFEQLGGLHRFIGWRGAILTDSGGFQVFSLPGSRSLDERGATFKSFDGKTIHLSPESSIAMQRALGSDVMMVLDQCIPSTSERGAARAAMELTHRWARRSLTARGESPQQLFAIVQGACFPDLRRESATVLTDLPFDGYAIGGLAVGETRAEREDTTELVASRLPVDRPRYLMGVGTPLDVLEGVHRGVDMFDCVLPTAWAQQGEVFTSAGRLHLRRGAYRLDEGPLDAACGCAACTQYTRAYLHHLVKCKEPLGWQLLANHNLRFYLALMRDIRAALAAGSFDALYRARRDQLEDHPAPAPQPKKKTRGAFEIVVSPRGFASVKHASGEIMHSVNDPDEEARIVYVGQASRVLDSGRDDLVVWDVGLGAGHNAMAMLQALAGKRATLISFERDLDAFHLALRHLPHLRHPAPHILAAKQAWRDGDLAWHLVLGDFIATLATQPAPDIIMYDPFSKRVDADMWTAATFAKVRAHLTKPCELITYSRSTAVRAAMTEAGFVVARGVPSGPKEETTVACAG